MVKNLKTEGYTISDACKALGMSRSWYYAGKNPQATKQRMKETGDRRVNEMIKEIKNNHPFWGYRRINAWLRHREGITVNEKKVRRLMKENGLNNPVIVHKAKRKMTRNKPRADRPLQYWGIDMTKFMVSSVGWVYLVIVLDWYTKKIVGWDISLRSKTEEWKTALEMGINREFSDGVRGKGLRLISDNGSQPTSRSFMKHMGILGIEQIFTTYDNPKGNAETERMMRTIKEEIVWLTEFKNYEEAKQKIGKWIDNDYNKFYVHSKLGYRSPVEFERYWYGEVEGFVA